MATRMPHPDELTAHFALPSIRAIVAEELIREHDMTQKQVAKRLGLTQPAISKYLTGRRGTALQLEQVEEIREIAGRTASLLAGRGAKDHDVLALPAEACDVVKEGRYMRTPHPRLEPTLDVNKCRACNEPLGSKSPLQLKSRLEEVSKLAGRLGGRRALVVPLRCEAWS